MNIFRLLNNLGNNSENLMEFRYSFFSLNYRKVLYMQAGKVTYTQIFFLQLLAAIWVSWICRSEALDWVWHLLLIWFLINFLREKRKITIGNFPAKEFAPPILSGGLLGNLPYFWDYVLHCWKFVICHILWLTLLKNILRLYSKIISRWYDFQSVHLGTAWRNF